MVLDFVILLEEKTCNTRFIFQIITHEQLQIHYEFNLFIHFIICLSQLIEGGWLVIFFMKNHRITMKIIKPVM